jgi:hypothetical protein
MGYYPYNGMPKKILLALHCSPTHYPAFMIKVNPVKVFFRLLERAKESA